MTTLKLTDRYDVFSDIEDIDHANQLSESALHTIVQNYAHFQYAPMLERFSTTSQLMRSELLNRAASNAGQLAKFNELLSNLPDRLTQTLREHYGVQHDDDIQTDLTALMRRIQVTTRTQYGQASRRSLSNRQYDLTLVAEHDGQFVEYYPALSSIFDYWIDDELAKDLPAGSELKIIHNFDQTLYLSVDGEPMTVAGFQHDTDLVKECAENDINVYPTLHDDLTLVLTTPTTFDWTDDQLASLLKTFDGQMSDGYGEGLVDDNYNANFFVNCPNDDYGLIITEPHVFTAEELPPKDHWETGVTMTQLINYLRQHDQPEKADVLATYPNGDGNMLDMLRAAWMFDWDIDPKDMDAPVFTWHVKKPEEWTSKLADYGQMMLLQIVEHIVKMKNL